MNKTSSRVNGIKPSGIRRFFDIAATMKDVISLGIGEPDFITPAPIVEAGIAVLQKGETHYTSNSGLIELRQAIASQLQQRYGPVYNPEDEILVTVGVSEALYLALAALLDPGDEMIFAEPCFVAYEATARMVGAVPVNIATSAVDGFQLTAEAVEKAITSKTKVLLLASPNNPTGTVIDRENLLKIASLVKKHNLVVVSDEIYDRLVYGVQHICFASLPGMFERTIVLQGFSKSYAMTGWRVGYAAGPGNLTTAMRKLHQYLIMSAPTVAQWAALKALEVGDRFVEEMRAEYDRRRQLIVPGLNAIGLSCIEPQGAFYAFPSIAKTGMDDHEFAELLLEEEHVAVVPGRAFGDSGQGFVRMSYATAYDKIEQALEHLAVFTQRHA
ncbi:MAG: aminotransferase class I/II-fold pyridoxal phosphate-dependent enzyme [Anaerolineae bacterium]|nr:aminotransferase class I/II-fold pyridoxal phosphate-dependent enzyme [Anaerolineae bacterium]